jgi:asparagine synthase (glutamine-hydrolysing)
MCGICGAVSLGGPLRIGPQIAERMIGALRHRGPDEFGAWRDEQVMLGHARLSIIDLAGGQQPMATGDGRYWITYNGEVYNYLELREELAARGRVFQTRSDTEVLLQAYAEWGEACVERFNGQFAFAIWDREARRLFLVRDRYGVRPLYLARAGDVLVFASEIKSLFAWPQCQRRLDPARIAEVLTYWVSVPPATVFAGVSQLPPGHVATCAGGDPVASPPPAPLPDCLAVRRYWHPTFLPAREDTRFVDRQERSAMIREVRGVLEDAAVIRLRSDVPVGAYLSGGIDSSAIAALIQTTTDRKLKTFSVGFVDRDFDETPWQRAMANHLGTDHRTVMVDGQQIAAQLAEAVWHAESPLLRTAPVPLFALSRLVRDEGYKVVLTGEGADEVFAGYDIFREAKVRAFWARDPRSEARSLLLTRLYPYLAQSPPQFLRRFYGQGLDRPREPFFSHRPRWSNGAMMTTFLAESALADLRSSAPEERLARTLPSAFAGWGTVARAQYLEMTTFLAGYLLSSQGDRMLMGNSVEGRFPFLDHRVADVAARLPASVKLPCLREKDLMRAAVADMLPPGIAARPKLPYRAPDLACFDSVAGRELIATWLAPAGVAAAGIWRPEQVASLRRKWQEGRLSAARETMALVGVVTTQILASQFGEDYTERVAATALAGDDLAWRSLPDGRGIMV